MSPEAQWFIGILLTGSGTGLIFFLNAVWGRMGRISDKIDLIVAALSNLTIDAARIEEKQAALRLDLDKAGEEIKELQASVAALHRRLDKAGVNSSFRGNGGT